MNRFLSMMLFLLFSAALCAQERYVTHFLGIPVDGTKTEMLSKLQEKGFRASTVGDLGGEFNGRSVYLFVVTNRDVVWRIMVGDAFQSSKAEIVSRFNRLCYQFKNNPKYVPLRDDQAIPDDEDISYEITVYDKRYEATFYQKDPADPDTASASGKRQEDDESLAKRPVWFTVSRHSNSTTDFRIMMYYDNEYNSGDDGSDL